MCGGGGGGEAVAGQTTAAVSSSKVNENNRQWILLPMKIPSPDKLICTPLICLMWR